MEESCTAQLNERFPATLLTLRQVPQHFCGRQERALPAPGLGLRDPRPEPEPEARQRERADGELTPATSCTRARSKAGEKESAYGSILST